jgi:hypothetical protein
MIDSTLPFDPQNNLGEEAIQKTSKLGNLGNTAVEECGKRFLWEMFFSYLAPADGNPSKSMAPPNP